MSFFDNHSLDATIGLSWSRVTSRATGEQVDKISVELNGDIQPVHYHTDLNCGFGCWRIMRHSKPGADRAIASIGTTARTVVNDTPIDSERAIIQKRIRDDVKKLRREDAE